MDDPQAAEHVEVGSFGYRLEELVYFLILIITVAAWAVIGFLVWFPLLIRTTVLFSASVAYCSLFRDEARVQRTRDALHFSVHLYAHGFRHFLEFYRNRRSPEATEGLLEPLAELKWRELIVECIWVIVVWSLTYLAFHTTTTAIFG